MLFKTINQNTIAAYALLPIFMIGIWMNAFLDVSHPAIVLNQDTMPLLTMVLSVLQQNVLVSTGVSIFLALIMALGVNRILNKYALVNIQTPMPGFIYLLFVSGFISIQKLSGIWFFTPLLLLAIERLFNGADQRKPMSWCFEAAFLLSIGSLFYAKGFYFILLLWISMFILRIFTLRSIVASLIGLLLPYFFAFAGYFLLDQGSVFMNLIRTNFTSAIPFYNHTLFSQIYIIAMSVLILVSIVSVANLMSVIKIISRKYYRILIWLIVLCVLAVLTPLFRNNFV